MSASLNGVNVNSSDKGASDGVDDDLGHKTLVQSSGDKQNSTGGVRVLDEANALDGETNNEAIDNGLKWNGFGYLDDRNNGSKNRVEELMSRDDGWGMMNLVGRVLGGNFGMDKEVEDENTSQSSPGINLVVDLKPWVDMLGELTSANGSDTYGTSSDGIGINGTGINEHTVMVNSGCLNENTVLHGKQGTVTNELVSDGKLESKEVDYSEAAVLMMEGYGKRDSMTNDLVPVRNPESKEINHVADDVFMKEGYGKNRDSIANELVPDGKSEIREVISAEAVVLMADGFQRQDSIANELVDGKSGIKVVDNVVANVFMMEGPEEHLLTEEKFKYCVSDLVWGKVRSHPWWPGQIFSPSDASDKAVQYFNFKNECYLMAYFGDSTFAWNEASKIKPFHMNFTEMEKQSNTEGFLHAVSCTLDEVSRRVECGLSCPCLPEEVRKKVKTQVVVNAGIREECSRRDGCGDIVSAAASFVPGELFQFIESLAENRTCKTDRLQFTVMKAQLLGFNRWKGRYQLPVFKEFWELVEDDTKFTEKWERSASVEVNNGVSSNKRKSTAQNVSSRKRKPPACNEKLPDTKEKQMPVLMSSSSPSLRNEDNKTVKWRGRKKGQKNLMSSQRVEIISNKSLTPDEILLKLSLAARNPLQGHEVMFPVVELLREFRNSVCLEKSIPQGQTELVENKGNGTSNMETADMFIFVAMEDSYWTDRIIQGSSQPQVLFEPEIPIDGIVNLDNDDKEKDYVLAASESGTPSVNGNEIAGEYHPTSLLLNFSNVESIPSVTNLNEIFRHFGTLKESETKILSKSKRAKVVFEKRADAEAAFCSTGKYRPFGESLVSYRLNFAPTPRKVCAPSKRNKKTQS